MLVGRVGFEPTMFAPLETNAHWCPINQSYHTTTRFLVLNLPVFRGIISFVSFGSTCDIQPKRDFWRDLMLKYDFDLSNSEKRRDTSPPQVEKPSGNL